MSSEIKWIKITTDMFEDEKIDFISSLPEADAIIVIWIRILALAGKCNAGGYVLLTEKIPYTEEMLAHKFKKPLNIVRLAMETFRRLDMIDYDNQIIFLPNWEKHQNIDEMLKIREQTKVRVQRHREKVKALKPPEDEECNVTVTPIETDDVTHGNALEVDRELDLLSTTTETIMDVYTKVFGQLHMNGLMSDFVRQLLNKGYTEVFIKELLYEAGESGTKPSLNYVKSIAERWIREGIYTRLEAKRRNAEKPNLRLAKTDKPQKTKQQLAIDREIALNKWVEQGGDPSEFVFESIS